MDDSITKAKALANHGELLAGTHVLLEVLNKNLCHHEALQLIIAISNHFADKKQSLDILKQCVQMGVDSSILQYELGSANLELGNFHEAIESFQKVLNENPINFEALHDMGASYALLGNKSKALKYLLEAAAVNDESADLQYNIGRLNDELLNYESAIECYQKAIKLDPFHIEALINLGIDLSIFKKYADSLKFLEKAYKLNPNINFLYGDCIYTKMRMCQWDDIEKIKTQLIGQINVGINVISPFPLSALIDSPAIQQKAAALYTNSKYPENLVLGPISSTQNKKIRVGYFSPDFHEHPVSYLMAEVFELHDRNQFEIFAFSYGKSVNDPIRERLKNSFDHFLDICDKTPQEICTLSRDLQIDIAVDLCGFTENARTEIFALRAAPIQINYIGYLGTMGSSYMDYIIADDIIIPTAFRNFYSENIIYLPSYQANDSKRIKSDEIYKKEDFGIQPDQFVFCNLNNTFKITKEMFDVWINILTSTPNSVLMLYAENPYARINLTQYASQKNIDAKRLIFVDRLPRERYLARYQVVDLFLDTAPYNAGATASDALWMGVPVITLQGHSFASRVASSLLTNIHLPELIHQNRESYLTQAISLANDPNMLFDLKIKLTENKLSAPLFNSSLFVKSLEESFQEAHLNYKNKIFLKNIMIKP